MQSAAAPSAYTLSLHDALPISGTLTTLYQFSGPDGANPVAELILGSDTNFYGTRSEEHTSELQSRRELVCRLLLEKKKIDKLVDLPDPAHLQPYLLRLLDQIRH